MKWYEKCQTSYSPAQLVYLGTTQDSSSEVFDSAKVKLHKNTCKCLHSELNVTRLKFFCKT